jgi:hypothetical protein
MRHATRQMNSLSKPHNKCITVIFNVHGSRTHSPLSQVSLRNRLSSHFLHRTCVSPSPKPQNPVPHPTPITAPNEPNLFCPFSFISHFCRIVLGCPLTFNRTPMGSHTQIQKIRKRCSMVSFFETPGMSSHNTHNTHDGNIILRRSKYLVPFTTTPSFLLFTRRRRTIDRIGVPSHFFFKSETGLVRLATYVTEVVTICLD